MPGAQERSPDELIVSLLVLTLRGARLSSLSMQNGREAVARRTLIAAAKMLVFATTTTLRP